MSATIPQASLDLQEQITRIDHLIAQTQKAQFDLDKGRVEITKTQFATRLAPWQIVASTASAGAALFAAGAAFVKLLGM